MTSRKRTKKNIMPKQSTKKKSKSKGKRKRKKSGGKKSGRCWTGDHPVKGKTPYSKGSCAKN